jgi:CRP-like cAMP-binding protein
METDAKKSLKKILVVDDDNDILEMLTEILSNAGHKVTVASDGVACTFKFNNEAFDLVITDIRMPKKDGIKLVEAIHASDSTRIMKQGSTARPTPVILVSASINDYQMEIELLRNIEILNKPFSPKEVVEKVANLLNIKTSSHTDSKVLDIKPGEILLKQGDPCKEIFFVKSGSLKVVRKSNQGLEVEIIKIGPGEMIGELGFLLDKKRSASVIAITECSLITIPIEKFETIISTQPKWFKTLFETIARRLEDTTLLLAEERSKKLT